jgi:hypothetical protein
VWAVPRGSAGEETLGSSREARDREGKSLKERRNWNRNLIICQASAWKVMGYYDSKQNKTTKQLWHVHNDRLSSLYLKILIQSFRGKVYVLHLNPIQ